jgi:hypothetical protein
MKNSFWVVLCVVIGVVAAFAKLVYNFFPLSNLMDVLVFAVLATGISYFRPCNPWRWVVLSVLPTMLLIINQLQKTDIAHLRDGVGVGWVYSFPLIFFGAALGGWLGRRIRLRMCKEGS